MAQLNTYTVYCHTNLINGKKYVGITKNVPEIRWGYNGINYKNCTLFWKAIEKYGWDNFSHDILETGLSEKEAIEKERYYIKLWDTMKTNGYNLTSGGEVNKEIDEEYRQRLRDSHLGIKYSETTRKNMSKAKMGHPGYNCKPVWMCDKITHEKIKYFKNSIEAEKFLNKGNTRAHIGHVCQGKRPSAYGYYWMFADKAEGGVDLSHN